VVVNVAALTNDASSSKAEEARSHVLFKTSAIEETHFSSTDPKWVKQRQADINESEIRTLQRITGSFQNSKSLSFIENYYKNKQPYCSKFHIKQQKPFACKLCNAMFAQSSNLIQHTRTHTGEKPFACELCDAKFTRNIDLGRHMRSHTGEKPFVCFLCDAKFSQDSHLVRHIRTHTGEKPFACELCDAKFTRSGDLERHMRTHWLKSR